MAIQNAEMAVLSMAMFFNRVLTMQLGDLDKHNPRLFNLRLAFGDSVLFCIDEDNNPCIGIPPELAYFGDIAWAQATIIRSANRLYLEVHDPKTGLLLMALGFYLSKSRLAALHHPSQDIQKKKMSLRLFTLHGDQVIFKEVLYSMIPMRELDRIEQMDNNINAEDAINAFDRSGAASSIQVVDMSLMGRMPKNRK